MGSDLEADQDEAMASAAARRWAVDAAGRTVYHPYGPGFPGFVVDAAREPALRAADRRYVETSKRLKPYAVLIALPAIFAFRHWLESRPILAFASMAGAVVVAAMADAMLRRTLIFRLLAGLPRVAPSDPLAAARHRRNGLIALALIGGIWLVLWLYDLRVAAAPEDRATIGFYPDLSQILLWAVALALAIWLLAAGWSRLVAKLGPNRMMIGMIVLCVIEVALVGRAGAIFFAPQPQLVISPDTLSCGHPRPWRSIARLSLSDGRLGSEYVRIELSDSHATVERCEITGLHADYETVYDAMRTAWLAAPSTPAVTHDEPSAAQRDATLRPQSHAWFACLERQARQIGPQTCGAPTRQQVDAVYRQCAAEEQALRRAAVPVFHNSEDAVDLWIKLSRDAVIGPSVKSEIVQARDQAGTKCPY
jgi:hypothetical protein